MGRVVIPGFRKIEISGGGEGGTTNYNDLTNKPFINNVPLVGNLKTLDLKLTDATLTEEGVPAEAKTVGQKLEEQSSNLNALSGQLGNHTVKSDVPENAVFTDTIYDDTEVKEEIADINSNLDKRISDNGYGEVAGGKNYWNTEFEVGGRNTTSGQNKSNNNIARSKDYITVDGIGSYSVSLDTIGADHYNSFIVYCYDSNKNYLGNSSSTMVTKTATRRVGYFTALSNTKYVRIADSFLSLCGRDLTKVSHVQIEKGLVATSYEPYFPSNKMLAEDVDSIKNDLTTLSDGEISGSANLIVPRLRSAESYGITCTYVGNGGFKLNGTSNGNATFRIDQPANNSISNLQTYNGAYRISLRDGSGNENPSGVGLSIMQNESWSIVLNSDSKKTATLNITNCFVLINVPIGKTLNNLIVYPQLEYGTVMTRFKPYIKSVKMLTDETDSIKNTLGGLSFFVNGTTLSITDGTNTWTLSQ